jgi:hypothetical protein
MSHYVYKLQSLKDNRYYIGETSNVGERLLFHNSGRRRSTRSGCSPAIGGALRTGRRGRWFPCPTASTQAGNPVCPTNGSLKGQVSCADLALVFEFSHPDKQIKPLA